MMLFGSVYQVRLAPMLQQRRFKCKISILRLKLLRKVLENNEHFVSVIWAHCEVFGRSEGALQLPC